MDNDWDQCIGSSLKYAGLRQAKNTYRAPADDRLEEVVAWVACERHLLGKWSGNRCHNRVVVRGKRAIRPKVRKSRRSGAYGLHVAGDLRCGAQRRQPCSSGREV